jgi:hypothetical protein
MVEGYDDAILEEMKKPGRINKYDVIHCLTDNLYNVPFSGREDSKPTFAVSVKRTGNSGIRMELQDGSNFLITLRESEEEGGSRDGTH